MLIFEYLYIRIYLYKIFLYKLPIRILYKKTLYKFILQPAQIPSLSHCQAWAIAKPELKPELDILVSLVSDLLPGSILLSWLQAGKKPAL